MPRKVSRYYQASFAMDKQLTAAGAKRIADYIMHELATDNDPAVVVAEIKPLAAAPINYPAVDRGE